MHSFIFNNILKSENKEIKIKILGNIILLPLKLIYLIGFIISIIGIILSTIFEHLSNLILGIFISLGILLILIYLILYGINITESPIKSTVIAMFILTIIFSLIPYVFKWLKNIFKKGLTSWF